METGHSRVNHLSRKNRIWYEVSDGKTTIKAKQYLNVITSSTSSGSTTVTEELPISPQDDDTPKPAENESNKGQVIEYTSFESGQWEENNNGGVYVESIDGWKSHRND